MTMQARRLHPEAFKPAGGDDRPRELNFKLANLNYPLLFHLLVPGGRWATVTLRPVSAAKAASSTFQARTRDPLDPPPPAQISNRCAAG